MSIVVAVSDSTRVYVACDSQATNNGSKMTLARPKFNRFPGGLIVVTCDLLTDQLLCECQMPFAVPGDKMGHHNDSLGDWARAHFVPWMRSLLRERDLLETAQDGSKGLWPGAVMLCHRASIVLVDNSGGVVEPARSWMSTGSGRDAADGAMWTMHRYGPLDPAMMARHAVLAACALDIGCSGPIFTTTTEPCYLSEGHSGHELLAEGEKCDACGFTINREEFMKP